MNSLRFAICEFNHLQSIKTIKPKLLLLAMVPAFSLQPLALRAQGALTPPGAPAPTMLTLSQIEPRTPISFSPSQIVINQPGSYYLTTNLTVIGGNAIVIAANNVTLDLNGFTIFSTSATPSGMAIQLGSGGGITNVTILNGHITSGITNSAGGVYGGGGFYYGIQYFSPSYNILVKDVSVIGCYYNGINLFVGNCTAVESCSVMIAGEAGIVASRVSRSTAYQCGGVGINADIASDCRGDVIGAGYGIVATTANNCYGYCTGSGYGLYAIGSANDCYGYCSGSGYGLYVAGSAIGCLGQSTAGVGIYAHIANSCTVGGGTANITYKYNMP
ncbi:MAG TPA: hypothetical protein VGY98_08595 [Verrucomicrobiae bacterium]|nr:hypothetical protein [Verrucomicrobiae bacterium]